jgi:hypothetical protein
MISGILALLAALTAPAAWFIFRKRKIPFLVGFAAAAIVGGVFYFGTSYIYGLELEREMYRFDLNRDREFSESELTDNAKAAMKRWSNDTGRTFAPIVAPIASFIWTSAIFVSFWGVSRIWSSKETRNEN